MLGGGPGYELDQTCKFEVWIFAAGKACLGFAITLVNGILGVEGEGSVITTGRKLSIPGVERAPEKATSNMKIQRRKVSGQGKNGVL